jgi:hypothetical protein
LTSLASNAVATVVMSISENACDRETLMRTLDGTPLPAVTPTQVQKPDWDGLKVTEHV